jgi:hypothetical protein
MENYMSEPFTIQNNTTGVQFIVKIAEDQTGNTVNMSGATSIQFIFQRPDKTILTVTGSLYTDGTDGNVQYTTLAGDLNLKGKWKLQVSYSLGSSVKMTSYTIFHVVANLSDGV